MTGGIPSGPEPPGALFTRPFLLLCGQLLAVATIVALFFPLQLYLDSLGFPPALTGLLLGADALAGMVAQACLAPIVTPRTARRWLLGGTLALALALCGEGFATQPALFAAARLLQGMGFIAVITALTVLMVLCIPPARSGQAFGLVSLIRLVPYATVPLLFDAIGLAPRDLAAAVRWAIPVALLPVVLLALTPVLPQERQAARPAGLGGVGRCLRDPNLRRLVAATALFYATNAITFYFLKGLAHRSGFADSGLFFTIATVTMILVRIVGARSFDRYPKRLLAGAALLLTGLVTFGLACGPARPFWFVLAVGCGLGWGVAMPLLNALGFACSRPEDRGLNQNLLFLAIQVGFFLGPLLGGALLARLGFQILFAATAAACLLSALLLWLPRPAAATSP